MRPKGVTLKRSDLLCLGLSTGVMRSLQVLLVAGVPMAGRRVWVPGKLWGSEDLTLLSGTRALLSQGCKVKSVGPAYGAG